jgi:3-deoxy-D-manno-octulosonic-acid transferase
LRYREYFARWRERFGFFDDPHIRDSIWVHAVSMGEVNAAMPLIDALMRRYQDTPFVITTVTPTGSERVRRVYGDRVFNVYCPTICRHRSSDFSAACIRAWRSSWKPKSGRTCFSNVSRTRFR